CADQRGRSEIDFEQNHREQRAYDRERNGKTEERMFGQLFVTRKPPREKKYRSQLRDLRWLKANRAESNPAAGAVDPHSDVRHVTQCQRGCGHADPNPPRALPEMVIDQRSRDAKHETDAEPDRLAFEEEQRVAVTIAGKSARAEKHYDADDQEAQHRNEQEVSAFL